MGILDRLTQLATTFEAKSHSPNGSEYAPNYVVSGSLPRLKLAGDESPLHATKDGKEGYSLNGAKEKEVRELYNEYDDGMVNSLPSLDKLTLDNPQPTHYKDLQTGDPVTVLYTSKNNYLNSLKEK